MRKLTSRQLILSLLFPLGIIICESFTYLGGSCVAVDLLPTNSIQWSAIISTLLCGILPIILTLTVGIDTGQYMLPRIIFSCFTLAAVAIMREMLGTNMPYGGVIMMLIVSVAASALYFYKFRPTKFSEWTVIFLSNPVLVALIYYLPLYTPNKPTFEV